ncbi:MAG: PAS domain-containing protein, partial [Polaromonas sp.]
MTLPATPEPARPWPFHSGDMAERIRGLNASSCPLGPPGDWPITLRQAIDMMLPADAQMVVFWGPEFITFYNDAYAPAIGEKHPAALASRAHDTWRELWDDLQPLLMGVWTTGQTFTAKDRPFKINRHGYLEEVYFDVSYSALRTEHGEMAGLICIVRETTQTVLAMRTLETSEARLSESHDQLRLAQVAGGVGLFLVDVHHNTLTGSKEFFRLFGLPNTDKLPVAELDALFVDKSGADAKGPSVPSSREARVRGDAPLEAEYRIRKADTGEVRWLARRAEFVRDAQGKPVFMRGVVQDVTERKASEANVKTSEARFRALVQTLPNQVWIANSEGLLTWFNQVVCDYTGLLAADMTGEAWTRTIHPDDLPPVVQTWTECLRTLAPYHIEFRVRRHDGAYRWHLVRAVPVETDSGVQWVGANTDIDDQRVL